jgi:hypothetical protein
MNNSFTDQASAIVHENRRLRLKVDNDERTIATLKAQLAADFKSAQQTWREIEHQLITERDRAVTAEKEIHGLLNEAADLIIQAAARRGVPVVASEERPEEQGLLEGRLKRLHGVAS